jgi:hypothetical protein
MVYMPCCLNLMLKRLDILSAVLAFSFIGWIIVQANKGSSNILFDLVALLPFGDKIGHMFLFGLLSAVTIIAFNYRQVHINGYKVPVGAIIAWVFTLIEELSQLFFMHRTFDLMDVAADLIGITLTESSICKEKINKHLTQCRHIST